MNIAFITNHYKTIFFYEVAKVLEEAGHRVFWMSPSRRWSVWLLKKGVPKSDILDTTDYSEEWVNIYKMKRMTSILQELKKLEESADLRINNIILMDRCLRLKSYAYAVSYLYVCNKHIKEFIMNREIKCVFGEVTWAFELLTTQICKELKVRFFMPHITRIPDGRFAFFEGYLHRDFFVMKDAEEKDYADAKIFYDKFVTQKPKPRYFYLNNKLPRVEFDWPLDLMKHFLLSITDPFDETRPSIKRLVGEKVRKVVNKRRLLGSKLIEKPLFDRPYILVTLHKQPEASVDVLGSFFSNQLEFVKLLSRAIPITHEIYVKEHSNAIGDRSMNFYKALAKIPDVKIISPYVNTYELIEKADLVYSISGTASYEAALLGKKALTAVPMFFSELLVEQSLPPHDAFCKIQDILDSDIDIETQKKKSYNFLAKLIANSFEGIVDSPTSDPVCIQKDNINKVAAGFIKLLDCLAR